MNFTIYKNKRVFITGHTGFKGSWLCEMLLLAGAKVYGYALQPPTKPALFDQLKLEKRITSHVIGDIRDIEALTKAISAAKPDFIFHLAAQPLVRFSYQEPVKTFETNVMGTVNLLESARRLDHKCRIVCITTDKIYENNNTGLAFKEDDPKGGSDPYSASKGACEIAIQSYQRSFFSNPDGNVWVAVARAGNVIGGGDWASDRIVPDAMRAFLFNNVLTVRNCESTRPWQHVLEPLCGYLTLGAQLDFAVFSTAYNFGPNMTTVKTVGRLVRQIMGYFDAPQFENCTDSAAVPEARLLTLNSRKANRQLGWTQRWNFHETVGQTVKWYQAVIGGADPIKITDTQIRTYNER